MFIEINPLLMERLNADHSYPIRIMSDENSKEITVNHVRGVNGADIEAVAIEIASADIMPTAVGVNILPKIVKHTAVGLKKMAGRKVQESVKTMSLPESLKAFSWIEKDSSLFELVSEFYRLLSEKMNLTDILHSCGKLRH